MISSTALIDAAGTAGWRRMTPEWARGPKLRDGHPVLRMPVRAGLVVLCQQGNSSPRGYTHSGGNCLYALDLSNCAEDVVDIVAAAPGRVAYVYGDSTPGDSSAGMRFGNQKYCPGRAQTIPVFNDGRCVPLTIDTFDDAERVLQWAHPPRRNDVRPAIRAIHFGEIDKYAVVVEIHLRKRRRSGAAAAALSWRSVVVYD